MFHVNLRGCSVNFAFWDFRIDIYSYGGAKTKVPNMIPMVSCNLNPPRGELQGIGDYPSSHNHGSGKWPPWRLKSSSRPPFSTTMIVGERVPEVAKVSSKKGPFGDFGDFYIFSCYNVKITERLYI